VVAAIAMGGGRRQVQPTLTLAILFIGGAPDPPVEASSIVRSSLQQLYADSFVRRLHRIVRQKRE
jgi:hypothetical protein